MVSAWRYRKRGRKCPDRTVGRYRDGPVCTVGRHYPGALCTVGRAKACVFQWRAFAVCAALECLHGTHVIACVAVQGVPSHRVPTRLVRPMALDSLVNETGLQQFAFGLGQHVRRLPASCLHVGARKKQAPVVVADVLPCNFQQQRAGVHAQTGICRAIQDGPGQGNEPAPIASAIALLASVTPVRHWCPKAWRQRPDVNSLPRCSDPAGMCARRGPDNAGARIQSPTPCAAAP